MPLLTVLPADVTFPVRDGENILDAVRRAGHHYHYGCKRGGCAECKAHIVSGEVRYDKRVAVDVLSNEERASGVCLTCRAVPVTDVVVRLRDGDGLTCQSHMLWNVVQRELAKMQQRSSKQAT